MVVPSGVVGQPLTAASGNNRFVLREKSYRLSGRGQADSQPREGGRVGRASLVDRGFHIGATRGAEIICQKCVGAVGRSRIGARAGPGSH